MSNHFDGSYSGFDSIIETYNRKRKDTPKGVSIKLQRTSKRSYILLQFVFPDSGKRSSKSCNVPFTEDGIILAVKKAWLVKDALQKCKTSSEFWDWYDRVILEKSDIVDDRVTYREIFEKLERQYWNGRNRNTKRKRSRNIPNDVHSFKRYYNVVFKRFNNWDKQPEWDEIESVLFSFKQGSKSFKDTYFVIKKICSYCPNKDKMIEKIDNIEHEQTDFKTKQSISLDEFLKWHQYAIDCISRIKYIKWREARNSWLWVASMAILYGLRPSEIAASLNLYKPITIDGYQFKSISDPNNKELLLVLGDKTFFGATIKTGSRVCIPMSKDEELIEKLRIQSPSLPTYSPKQNSIEKTIVTGFAGKFREWMNRMKCPTSEMYSFRHLANQLGERSGIPQEIRARSLGHSVSVNDSIYKSRKNIKTNVDLLLNHKRGTSNLDDAIAVAKRLGIIENPQVIELLEAIYHQPLDDLT